MIPLVDPGGGGLYKTGLNTPPEEHRRIGIELGRLIEKLDKNGRPDPKGKKVMLLGPGMSNTKRKAKGFTEVIRAEYQRRRDFTLFDACLFGRDLTYLFNNWPEYESWLLGRFANERINISPLQVQAMWWTNSVKGQSKPKEETIYEAQLYYEFVLNKAKQLFPNLRQVFVSSSGCSFYSKKPHLRREPNAGWEGEGVRNFVDTHLFEDDIYVDWGPYMWADGPTPRRFDGLSWLPQHFEIDGLHPSPAGSAVWGQHLFRFFRDNPATAGWFVPPALGSNRKR